MEATAGLPGIGWQSLALSLASLGAVCLVAWVALRLLAGRGVGRASGAIRVVARCPLEPRRSVYVVEVAGRAFLVGVGDGPMSLLAELDGDKLPRPAAAPGLPGGVQKFADVLGRALARARPPEGPAAAGEGTGGPPPPERA